LNRELQEMKQQIGEQESAAHKMHVRMDMLEVVEQVSGEEWYDIAPRSTHPVCG
jgi:DNA-binding IclR family transcriptional regulator